MVKKDKEIEKDQINKSGQQRSFKSSTFSLVGCFPLTFLLPSSAYDFFLTRFYTTCTLVQTNHNIPLLLLHSFLFTQFPQIEINTQDHCLFKGIHRESVVFSKVHRER